MSRAHTILALVAVLAACREHDPALDHKPGAATAPAAANATTSPTAPRTMYDRGASAFVDVVARARASVVAIRAGSPVKSGPAAMFPGAPERAADPALGTGFLVETRGVYVVTTDHIAAASPEPHVILGDGTDVQAKVIGRDPRLDIALLAIDHPRLTALPLGDSDDLRVGEWVLALGDPFGDEVTASAGIVAATGRGGSGSLAAGTAPGFRTFIQTDARIHRGNSGGPLIDTAGQVVGVAIATSDHPGELSFAIPINRVREVLDALRDQGRVARGWLGVLVKPVPPELAQAVALAKPGGALVTELVANSPATRAGLRPGDIILTWADRDIDARSLPWLVASAAVGKPVSVTLWRDKAALTIAVTTEPMPE